ncbi:MAG: 50S ribosomal protein L18 [Candidatus Omnitrophica bacterium]|nr:50S ribosomal protein L18 [Candidatus Omnitrophota bacterium]
MLKKQLGRLKRHRRIRKKISGTSERPRVSIYRSLNHLYVQAIDDIQAKTLVSLSTLDKNFSKQESASGGKTGKAEVLGLQFGQKLKEKGIDKVAFDRGGYLYHGRVKALADALRQAGIQV